LITATSLHSQRMQLRLQFSTYLFFVILIWVHLCISDFHKCFSITQRYACLTFTFLWTTRFYDLCFCSSSSLFHHHHHLLCLSSSPFHHHQLLLHYRKVCILNLYFFMNHNLFLPIILFTVQIKKFVLWYSLFHHHHNHHLLHFIMFSVFQCF